jgi:DNA/RNA endonuclease YhcR with UshA esterase domain
MVYRTHNSGSAVFLNFSQEQQKNGFTAVIFPDDWTKFPAPPEELFYGKLVRVEGAVQEYKGTPEIIIKEPWQIEVALTLGQPVTCNCPAQVNPMPASETVVATTPEAELIEPVPADTASAPQAETVEVQAADAAGAKLVSWEEAANYVGQTITVAGTVVDTYNSGKVVFLNFGQDYRNSFKIVIFPDAWDKFPAPPEIYYQHQAVQVTGQVEIYQNSPEIVVDQPDQIVMME